MIKTAIIQKLKSGKYRLYSKKKGKDGKRRNLGTYDSLEGAKKREREVQFFKHHADDGEADDKETSALSKLSDIASFLEEAGFIDASESVYKAMSAIDGDMCEDHMNDGIMASVPDIQTNYSGASDYKINKDDMATQQVDFSAPIAMASLANRLDKLGLYGEADMLDDILSDDNLYDLGDNTDDDMFDIIGDLEELHNGDKTNKETDLSEKQDEEVLARLNGITEDTTATNMFSGLSDSYFYGPIGVVDQKIS